MTVYIVIFDAGNAAEAEEYIYGVYAEQATAEVVQRDLGGRARVEPWAVA